MFNTDVSDTSIAPAVPTTPKARKRWLSKLQMTTWSVWGPLYKLRKLIWQDRVEFVKKSIKSSSLIWRSRERGALKVVNCYGKRPTKSNKTGIKAKRIHQAFRWPDRLGITATQTDCLLPLFTKHSQFAIATWQMPKTPRSTTTIWLI